LYEEDIFIRKKKKVNKKKKHYEDKESIKAQARGQ
jgi:hypothetical protein